MLEAEKSKKSKIERSEKKRESKLLTIIIHCYYYIYILLDTESPTTKRDRLSGILVLPTSKEQEIARKDFPSM